MRVAAIGDVCTESGVRFLEDRLPVFRRGGGIDAVIVNAENSAGYAGVSRDTAQRIFAAGADVITTGNHAFRHKDAEFIFDDMPALLRPHNFSRELPGCGIYTLDMGRAQLAVINLSGMAFMSEAERSPFAELDILLKGMDEKFIVVDFHAEATSEKGALALYADGRVSAVVGTHTHVQTADARVLAKGTGFITDLGMTGPVNSLLGVEPAEAIRRQRLHVPVRFKPASGECAMHGVVMQLDDETGRCVKMETVKEY